MKKLQIYHYHGQNQEWEEKTGYKHLEEYPAMNYDMIVLIQKAMFEEGLNTMLCHLDEDRCVLYVDNGRFRQR